MAKEYGICNDLLSFVRKDDTLMINIKENSNQKHKYRVELLGVKYEIEKQTVCINRIDVGYNDKKNFYSTFVNIVNTPLLDLYLRIAYINEDEAKTEDDVINNLPYVDKHLIISNSILGKQLSTYTYTVSNQKEAMQELLITVQTFNEKQEKEEV